MRIRITSVPAGGAPLKIRKQWVGMVLPVDLVVPEEVSVFLVGDIDGITGQPYSADDLNLTGYSVLKSEAINALREAGRVEAADYWQALVRTGHDVLIFSRQFCEVVEE